MTAPSSAEPARPGPGRRVIGLTGGIGAGKTTVATRLAELGATVIDCDALGRLVVEPDGSAYPALVDRFGVEVLLPDGRLDRAALASRVFDDPVALADLNAITHPAIDVEIADRIAAAATQAVVLDMAVLVESDLGRGLYGEVLVVEAPLEVRLNRLTTERGMTEAEARSRIASQATDCQRRAVADHVIVNDGSIDELTAAVDRYWRSADLG